MIKCHCIIHYGSGRRHIVPKTQKSAFQTIKTGIKRDITLGPHHGKKPKTIEEAKLFGMGIGLYWGEGTKANLHAVRLGNIDPELLKMFILFLEKIFSVDKKKMKFGLQVFNDIDPQVAIKYWTKQLRVKKEQFYKATVSKSQSLGTYRKKAPHGVVTIYYNNVKLRNLLVSMLPKQ